MRAIIVAVFLVGAFVAGTFISEANPVSADTPPKKSQWQYQCFEASGVADVTERSNKLGSRRRDGALQQDGAARLGARDFRWHQGLDALVLQASTLEANEVSLAAGSLPSPSWVI
ncbi:MAG: hypothetical protein JRJ24_20625 [Deltaproteobacteria bacterium]|nr:hypothetical protein [Deltaproteobacteria bacterium]